MFQGTADGKFVAFRADNGRRLWDFPAQTGIVAPAMTYEIDGEQYVSVNAGWGGAFALWIGCSLLGALLILPLWRSRGRTR